MPMNRERNENARFQIYRLIFILQRITFRLCFDRMIDLTWIELLSSGQPVDSILFMATQPNALMVFVLKFL